MATTEPQSGDADRNGGDAGVRTVQGPDGRRIGYATYGAPDGDPVLFLHGTPGAHTGGELLAERARDNGVRLLCPSRPGYAASTHWPERTLADTAAFVGPVLDDAGVDDVDVVGFSGGGPHALALAAGRADRVRRVDVVAGATPPDCGPKPPAMQRVLRWEAAHAPRLLGAFVRVQAWVATHAGPDAVVSQYTASERDDPVPDRVADAVAEEFRTAVGRQRAGLVHETRLLGRDWELPLAEVDAPVTLHHSGRDTNVPIAGARALAARLPNATLETYEGADHLGTLLASRDAVLSRRAERPESGP